MVAVDSTLNVVVVVAVHLDLSYLFLYLYSSIYLCQRLSSEDHVEKRIHCRESTSRALSMNDSHLFGLQIMPSQVYCESVLIEVGLNVRASRD